MSKPTGVTLGDICGVGPEILLRAFHQGRLNSPLVVYGSAQALDLAEKKLGLCCEIHRIASPEQAQPGRLNLIDDGAIDSREIPIGTIWRPAGKAAVEWVRAAALDALAGRIAGFATLPINKEACRLSFPEFEGHTEFVAGLCDTADYTMMLVSPKMIVTHVSTHVSLREAINRVKTERVLAVLRLTAASVARLRSRARIAVAGLNPHAGEHGAFGTEEIEEIEPAIRAAQEEGIDAHGPVPPDTLFFKMLSGEYDAAVCMYHDQGHIPMKLHGFDDAINTTIGLPIVRTSVDHGTAFDIAYQGKASLGSFLLAFDLARKLSGS